MSTYPRTYDLLHADSVFSLYRDRYILPHAMQDLVLNIFNLNFFYLNTIDDCRCEMEDILLEMDRILRPEGTVIMRDDVDVLARVKSITDGMRWDSQIVDHEEGPHQREKILLAVKRYWTAQQEQAQERAS